MSRPALDSIQRTDANWLTKLNANFQKLLDAPFPPAVYADLSTLSANKDARLYSGCVAIAGGFIYISNGTSWIRYNRQLTLIADLNPATATIADIRTAYNNLLTDMKAKDWMATS